MDTPPALNGSGWVPLRTLGQGGGGIVYLAVRETLARQFEMFGHKVVDETKRQIGQNAAPPSADYLEAVPKLIDGLMAAIRNRDGIAAVKVPKASDGRFLAEVEAMENFRHPALLKLIDRDKGNLPKWFAAEYHARDSLERTDNLSVYYGRPLVALEALRPIAEGLAQIHQAGGVHRDVKPKNIYVADDGRLILGDFGILIPGPKAERFTGAAPVHSRDWMPDWVQFGDQRAYESDVDVFAWARTLYFLIDREKVMASHIDDSTAALASKIPESRGLSSVIDLLRRCIVTKKKSMTIVTGAQLVAEIDAIIENETRSPGCLIFSFLSVDRNAPLDLESTPDSNGNLRPVVGLNGVKVFLPSSATRFKALARCRGNGGEIQFCIDDGVSQRMKIEKSGSDRVWTDTIHMSKPLKPGVHELSVMGVGAGTEITALMVYTD